jgi:hypothetical protein
LFASASKTAIPVCASANTVSLNKLFLAILFILLETLQEERKSIPVRKKMIGRETGVK